MKHITRFFVAIFILEYVLIDLSCSLRVSKNVIISNENKPTSTSDLENYNEEKNRKGKFNKLEKQLNHNKKITLGLTHPVSKRKKAIKQSNDEEAFNIDLAGDRDSFFEMDSNPSGTRLPISLLINNKNRTEITIQLFKIINSGFCDFFQEFGYNDKNFRYVPIKITPRARNRKLKRARVKAAEHPSTVRKNNSNVGFGDFEGIGVDDLNTNVNTPIDSSTVTSSTETKSFQTVPNNNTNQYNSTFHNMSSFFASFLPFPFSHHIPSFDKVESPKVAVDQHFTASEQVSQLTNEPATKEKHFSQPTSNSGNNGKGDEAKNKNYTNQLDHFEPNHQKPSSSNGDSKEYTNSTSHTSNNYNNTQTYLTKTNLQKEGSNPIKTSNADRPVLQPFNHTAHSANHSDRPIVQPLNHTTHLANHSTLNLTQLQTYISHNFNVSLNFSPLFNHNYNFTSNHTMIPNPNIPKVTNTTGSLPIVVVNPPLCSICGELSKSIQNLFLVIKRLEVDFMLSSAKKYTRQGQIIVLTNWLNLVNLIKTVIFKIGEIQTSIKDIQCQNLPINAKYLTTVNNFVGQLVDILQRTIRKENLNISWIILT